MVSRPSISCRVGPRSRGGRGARHQAASTLDNLAQGADELGDYDRAEELGQGGGGGGMPALIGATLPAQPDSLKKRSPFVARWAWKSSTCFLYRVWG